MAKRERGEPLRYYARLYDDLHQGETYTAEAFVLWLIREKGFESNIAPRQEPAGRPRGKQMLETSAA